MRKKKENFKSNENQNRETGTIRTHRGHDRMQSAQRFRDILINP